jgi:hypothetical protein
MTNFLLSVILGLWLLLAVAFYAWVAGAVLCSILIELRRSFRAMTRTGRGFTFPSSGRRTAIFVLAGILVLLAASYAWSTTSLVRCCGLAAIAAVPAAWLLARHVRD